MKKRVEVVTPVFNRREITLQCLGSLSRVDLTGLEIHTTIVDDGSTDGTGDAIREQFPEVDVIDGTGDLWYTAGTNLGVEAALKNNPDYVLCINDDSKFDENAIRLMVECAERHPRSVIGALLLLWDRPEHIFQVAPYWDTTKGGWQHWYQQTTSTIPTVPWKVELIVGNCVLYPAGVFAEAGMMDPNISAQYGDAEFTTRLRKLGWNLLIEPKAHVFCKPNYEHVSVMSLPLSKKLNTWFVDTRKGGNLIHQFRQNWHTAPSRLAGAAGFFAFYFSWLKRKLSGSQASVQEPPLSQRYADAVVE